MAENEETPEEVPIRMMKRIKIKGIDPEREHNPIRKNLKKLVKNTEDVDLILETMLKNGVFDEYIAYDILKEENERDRKVTMYEEVANGGPGSVAKLCSCFLEVRLSHLAKHLDPKFNFLNNSTVSDGSGDASLIFEKLDFLVKGTGDLNLLLPKLIGKRAFDAKIWNLVEAEDENEKKMKLYILAANCGPVAVNKLRECFQELKLHSLVELLRETSEVRQAVYAQPNPQRRMDINNLLKVYKLRSSPKGYVLLINMEHNINEEERKGMNMDIKNVTELWTYLGYQVIFKSNLSQREFEYEVKAFSYMYDLNDVDSGVVFVMTHGKPLKDVDGCLTRDKRCVRYDWLVDQFTDAHCPQLAGKPKMFFFYTCSGAGVDSTPEIFKYTVSTAPEPTDTILVRCYTPACNTSAESDLYGSCLIEGICEIFKQHAENEHLEKLLKYVDHYLKIKYEEEWDLHCLTHENRSFNMDLYFGSS